MTVGVACTPRRVGSAHRRSFREAVRGGHSPPYGNGTPAEDHSPKPLVDGELTAAPQSAGYRPARANR
jgi:hypothetical protein